MKFYFFNILIFSFLLSAEMINLNPDLNENQLFSGGWKEPSQDQMKIIDSLKIFKPEIFIEKADLPDSIDNSKSIFFRPVFSQYSNECSQASGVGYAFTYEINRSRGTNANFNKNQFPTYFTYNFLNGGDENKGSNYFDAWEIIKREGCPYNLDYGGMVPTEDPDLRGILWMSGYDKYERAMENRISEIFALPTDTPEGLDNLKRWLFDRGDGSSAGGVAVFSAGVLNSWETDTLHQGTVHSGETVITKWHTTVNHAMTIVGYNDSIRYDYNGDGKFTNDIDINGDDFVDLKDWEIGALLMVNSWDYTWGDNGRSWVMYNTLGYEHWEGGIWTQTAHAIKTFDYYTPLLKLHTEIDYPDRNNLKIYAGISNDPDSVKPEKTLELLMLDHAGGNYPMSGDSTYIDLGLDITPLISDFENNSEARIFLCVTERDSFFTSEGKIISMSVTDVWDTTVSSGENDKIIADNDTTYVSIMMPIFYNTPLITVNTLPEIVPDEPYNFQMTSRGGRDPFIWSLLIDYMEMENTNQFPSGEFVPAVFPHNNPDNDIIPVKLDFKFPYYGNLYDSVFVCTDGYICFENKYFYIQDEESLTGTKVIAPHANDLTCYPQDGNGVYLLTDSNSFTAVWDASMREDETADLKFACKILSDGKIEFYHGEDQTENVEWYSGISNGDSENFIIPSTSNAANSSGLKTSFTESDFPYGISLNETGILSGLVTDYNKVWPLTIKVTDWNGISSEKTFDLRSSTGIEETGEITGYTISNYPNPFNPATLISFNILNQGNISLIIYNSSGQLVDTILENNIFKPGRHSVTWNPEGLTSGLYYSVLKIENKTVIYDKMLFLK